MSRFLKEAGFFMSKSTVKYQVILHVIVLVWGLTGILGDEITLSSSKIVFFRTGIAFVSLVLAGFFIKSKQKLSLQRITYIMIIGVIVGLHWFTFFQAIKVSTVSIGVVCMSMTTLFVSILEPIIFKRKISVSEIVISIFILIGIVIIFGFEIQYVTGIIFGLTSAFLAALFSVLNGKLIKTTSPFSITKYEMLGAVIVSFGIVSYNSEVNSSLFDATNADWIMLVILGIVCTTIAFMLSVWVMKFLSPFTVSISINMEPIYTIVIAIILNPLKEQMSVGFYVGGLIIISAIFTNAYLKKIKRKKIPISD